MLFFISADIQTVVDDTNTERKENMKKVDIEKEPCSECSGKLEKRYISQDFEREG
mgnify:CR=1 FL=1